MYLRYTAFLYLLAAMLIMEGCKKDDAGLLHEACDIVFTDAPTGKDYILIPLVDGTSKGFFPDGQEIWSLPVSWTIARIYQDLLYGVNGNIVYIINPVSGELIDSVAIDHEVQNSSIHIWNDLLVYVPAYDGSPCCEILLKDLKSDSPSTLVGFYDQLQSKEVFGNHLITKLNGSESTKIMDLETGVETDLPYNWLVHFDTDDHYYSADFADSSRWLRSLSYPDLSLRWEVDITGTSLGLPEKLENGLLYFSGGIDTSHPAPLTLLDPETGAIVHQQNLENVSSWPSFLDIPGLFVSQVGQTGWGGSISENDPCTGAEIWSAGLFYGPLHGGLEIIVQDGIRNILVLDRATGDVLSNIDPGAPKRRITLYSKRD